jgi:prephenate dehydrogenase
VVLALPVGGIIDMLERLGPALPAETLLTDVGSTKAEIVARAQSIFGKQAAARFLPGHPMAGKELSGVDQADANLFQGATWFLVADDHSVHPHAEEYKTLLRSIGAKVVPISDERHDELCAFISHLPQMVSTAMAGVALDYREQFSDRANPQLDIGNITSRGFREMTRTASSPYSMWRDVAITNSANIEKALLALEHRLAHIRENLKTPELRAEFERAAQIAPRKPAK